MEKNIYYTLKILRLHCYISDEDDSDEVFLKFNGEKIWPESKYVEMKEGTEMVGFETKVEKGKSVKFEIWDYDMFSPNDLLGEVNIVADKVGGPFTTDMIRKEAGNARYSLEWEMY